jgi:hypothetical protein
VILTARSQAAYAIGAVVPRVGQVYSLVDRLTFLPHEHAGWAGILWREEDLPMPLWIQLLIAGVVSIGVIAVGKAIVTGLAISRRPSHHLAQQSGTSPASKEAEHPSPSG